MFSAALQAGLPRPLTGQRERSYLDGSHTQSSSDLGEARLVGSILRWRQQGNEHEQHYDRQVLHSNRGVNMLPLAMRPKNTSKADKDVFLWKGML